MKFTYLFCLSLIVFNCKNQETREVPQSTHPVWSPDGSKIAFINNSEGVEANNAIDFEVFTMNADGGDLTQHTFNDAFEADISWSPDGSKLAIKSYRDGNDEVYIIDLITNDQRNISNHPAHDGSPCWVGNRIFFRSKRDHEKGELYEYNLETEVISRLTDNDMDEVGAVWSPDENMVAFTSGATGNDELYLMTTNGDSVVQLTNNELNDWYPQWSPDGTSILFTYGDWNTDIWELRRIELDTKNESVVLKGTDSGNASWHPKGEVIAYGSSKSGKGEIYSYDLSSKTSVQITK
ncbi:hypothetical protein AAOE16_01115 [Ekhidna sp. MALMAid0563]|uniref:eIF2A-related protein n=1 Tax=Ekhidna sp. MALMAid0563 TaxID=3143937 RepID=UPI0032E0457C